MRHDSHLLVLTLLVCLGVDGVRFASSAKSRRGRQWIGQLEVPTDCTFPIVATDRSNSSDKSSVDQVSLCNFTSSGPLVDGVYPWRKGLASLANWLGGPTTDASNSSADGGYAFFETSSLSVQQLPGIQSKAWFKSPVYQATTPSGRCLRFAYNIQGVSAARLRLLRVQLVPLEGQRAAPSQTAAPLIVNSILMPTLSSQQPSDQRAFGSEETLAKPWTPYRNILVNHTDGWQEVVDDVWLSSDSTSGRWLDGHVTYSSPYPHAFIFEAVPDLAYLQYRGYVAVDNLRFSSGPCESECEFNTDFCQWSNQVEDDDFDWSLSRGSLWTSTGPIRDQLSSQHNFNFGGYAFIDSRQPHYAGSRASLTSNVLPATGSDQSSDSLCFVFWVHMFGAGVGRLRVLQRRADNSSGAARELWQLSQLVPRDSWHRAQVTVSSSTPFTITLEATVGETGYGDIAVDSFRIENGSCPGLPEWAVNKGVDCTFQNGNCGWVLTNSQPGITSMWTRSSLDVIAGRPDGHWQQNVLSQTTNSYMLFDTYQNGHKAGSRGFVSSPLQAGNQPQCLSFWFYMASASPVFIRLGALEVVLFEPNAANTSSNATRDGHSTKTTSIVSTTLWRLENHRQEKWLSAQVSFVAASGGYVSFVGTRGEGIRGIIAVDDVTLFQGPCPIRPSEASVSPVDCSFDHNMCRWSVDSQTVELPVSPEIIATPQGAQVGGEEEELATTTETATENLFVSRLEPSVVSEKKSSSSYENQQPPESPVNSDDDSAAPLTTTTDTNIVSFGEGAVSTELIQSEGRPLSVNDPFDTTLTSRQSSTEPLQNDATTATVDDVPAVTIAPDSTSMTSTSTADGTTEAEMNSSVNGTAKVESSSNNVINNNNNKDMAVRGVSGLYDEITSFGTNTIEVISTSRDGATKSIIISQPGRSRFRRSVHGHWVGYNWPRQSRIVHYRNNRPAEDVAWRRPLPVPHWLRSRQPALRDETDHSIRSQITPYAAYQQQLSSSSPQRTASTPPSKLFAISNTLRPVQPIADYNSTQLNVKKDPRWVLAGASSLYGVRDHTFHFTEGGYVYLEGTGKAITSRLFSPIIPASNSTLCLSFFFTMAYNSPNSTLTVYRLTNGPMEELWRVTSTALDRSAGLTKSPWIPARLPIPPNEGINQRIVVEGSTDSGAIALDDIRLQPIACTSRP